MATKEIGQIAGPRLFGALSAGVDAQHVRYNGGTNIVALRPGIATAGANGIQSGAEHALVQMLRPLKEQAVGEPDINAHGLSPQKMARDFLDGRSSIFVDLETDSAMAYGTLKPRLTPEIKQNAGLTGIDYEIMELGTVIVLSTYRGSANGNGNGNGSGLATSLVADILESHADKLHRGTLLIIATMKSPITMLTFRNAFSRNGYQPAFVNHLDYSMIAPLTCVCLPDFGYGFQVAPPAGCSERIEDTEHLAVINNHNGQRIHESDLEQLHGRCVMFVSDYSLAAEVDQAIRIELRRQGASPTESSRIVTTGLDAQLASLVRRLDSTGYYPYPSE